MSDVICYCFNYTHTDIRRDIAEHGKSTILEKIVFEKKMGGCRCELLNPKGRWCLGDVRRVVDAVMKENEDCGLSREDRGRIRQDIAAKYRNVAVNAEGSFAYPTGRTGLEGQRYPSEVLKTLPEEVLASFCGVGNPFSLGDTPPGAAVLDIGCGAGVDCLVAAALAGSMGTVTGIDLVPEMIARARENARLAATANVSFLTGSAEALPFPEASFDMVISNGVFNLVPDKSRALREVMRVLKPEGRFYLADQAAVSAPSRDTGAKVAAWAG